MMIIDRRTDAGHWFYMKNKQKRSQKDIETHYDNIVINEIIPKLAKGKLNAGEFMDRIAALKKQKDNDLLVEAREIPPLRAPKAVGLGTGGFDNRRRQGVN